MHGCLAPSEIPGITAGEASVFGGLAEDIVYADFRAQYPTTGRQLFCDDNNPASYLLFLAANNPQFTAAVQHDWFRRVRTAGLMRVPDIVVHTPAERAFYEIKPDSAAGRAAGVEKVGYLQAIYTEFRLPYRGGTRFQPRDHRVAALGNALRATLRVALIGPGLVTYQLCLDTDGEVELATLALLLALIVRELNKQAGGRRLTPVDLEPLVRQHRDLTGLATALGIAAGAATAAVGWRWFWRAVVARFALRGATAATLAVADGPLPIGDLLAAGLALWTIVDVVRYRDELWREAERLARA